MTAIDATGWTAEQQRDADALHDAFPDDPALPDYPLPALADLIESAMTTARTVEDQLREHGKSIVPSAATGAFDTLIKGAYLKAEDDVVSALSLLQHAAQLVNGLAR